MAIQSIIPILKKATKSYSEKYDEKVDETTNAVLKETVMLKREVNDNFSLIKVEYNPQYKSIVVQETTWTDGPVVKFIKIKKVYNCFTKGDAYVYSANWLQTIHEDYFKSEVMKDRQMKKFINILDEIRSALDSC